MRRKQRVQEGKVEAEGNGTYEDEEKDQVDYRTERGDETSLHRHCTPTTVSGHGQPQPKYSR